MSKKRDRDDGRKKKKKKKGGRRRTRRKSRRRKRRKTRRKKRKRKKRSKKKRGGWQRKYNEDNIGAFYNCQNQGNNSVYREKNIITGRWDELRPIDEWKIIEMEDSREYDPILKLFDKSNPDFGEFRVEAQQLCNRSYVPLKRNASKTGAGRRKRTRKKR